MRKIMVTMSHKAYAEMLKLEGIDGKKKNLLKYINDTYGLLGEVVDIQFDD